MLDHPTGDGDDNVERPPRLAHCAFVPLMYTLRAHLVSDFVKKCSDLNLYPKWGIFGMGKKHKKHPVIQILCEGVGALSAWEGTWSSSPTQGIALPPTPTSSPPCKSAPPGQTTPPHHPWIRPPPTAFPRAHTVARGKSDLAVARGPLRDGEMTRLRENTLRNWSSSGWSEGKWAFLFQALILG